MKKITYVLFAAIIFCLILNAHDAWSQKVQQMINAEFSSPDKPGKIKLSWMLGNVTVKVNKEPGVSIQLLRKAEPAIEEGLTLIKSSKTTFSLPIEAFEEDNVITIRTFSSDGYYDILLLVPPPTSLQINNTSGDIIVEDLTGRMGEIDAEERFMRRMPREEVEDIAGRMGEIDVKCDHGDILLSGITGPVTANSQYGTITAEFTAINHDKPMSFATVNKDITLLLPPDTKATLSLNTKGYIATNMDLNKFKKCQISNN
ncbi:hypothetical protein AMJ80_02795 [bacterium SM23_31]|nr:MAG: hypothetical protein AMJ80_02795 [bacterium SM23_31]